MLFLRTEGFQCDSYYTQVHTQYPHTHNDLVTRNEIDRILSVMSDWTARVLNLNMEYDCKGELNK